MSLRRMGPKGSLPGFLLAFALGGRSQRKIGQSFSVSWGVLGRVFAQVFARFGLLVIRGCASRRNRRSRIVLLWFLEPLHWSP